MNIENIIDDNMGLIKHLVAQYNPPNDDIREQLIEAGRIGFWKAFKAYDAKTYKTKLPTIATQSIHWEIINTLKELKSHTIPLSHSPEPYYTPTTAIWEYLPDNLSQLDKKVVDLRLSRYTVQEIADLLDKSYITTRRLVTKIIYVLRRANCEQKETTSICTH